MEPPALSFIPNTQGSSARPPPNSRSLRCCPRPILGGVGVGWSGQESQWMQVGRVTTCSLKENWAQLGPPHLCLRWTDGQLAEDWGGMRRRQVKPLSHVGPLACVASLKTSR